MALHDSDRLSGSHIIPETRSGCAIAAGIESACTIHIAAAACAAAAQSSRNLFLSCDAQAEDPMEGAGRLSTFVDEVVNMSRSSSRSVRWSHTLATVLLLAAGCGSQRAREALCGRVVRRAVRVRSSSRHSQRVPDGCPGSNFCVARRLRVGLS